MIRWSKDTNLWLLTEAEFAQIPDGTLLISISGNKAVKGRDYIDDETRGGYIAYGIVDPEQHELAPLLMQFKLKTA